MLTPSIYPLESVKTLFFILLFDQTGHHLLHIFRLMRRSKLRPSGGCKFHIPLTPIRD